MVSTMRRKQTIDTTDELYISSLQMNEYMAGQKLAEYGCMNPMALNYNPNATEQYGECIVCADNEVPLILMMSDSYGDGWNGYYLKINSGDIEVESFTLNSGYNSYIEFCLEQGSYTYELVGGSYLNEISWEITYIDTIVASSSWLNVSSFDIHQQIQLPIQLSMGWSIISNPTDSIKKIQPSTAYENTLYGYSSLEGGYTNESTLKPESGYWIYADVSRTIYLIDV